MLTRQYLKSLGVEGDKIDSIIEAHVDTMDGLKAKVTELQTENETFKTVASERDQLKVDLEKATKQINTLKEKATANDGAIAERDQLKTEVDSLKAQITEFTERETATTEELTGLREKVSTFEADKNNAVAEAEKAKTELEAYKTQVETDKTNAAKREAVRTALRNGGVARSDFQDLIISSMSMDNITLGENGIEGVDTLIESTKSKYPSCFGTVTEGGTPKVEPMGGNPEKLLTKEQISAMSSDEINAKWDLVQKSMAALKQ